MSAVFHPRFLHRLMLAIGAAMILVATGGAAPVLTVNEVELADQTTGVVPVGFRSEVNVAAMQMDVLFDPARYTSSAATPGTLPTAFRVDSFLAEPGRLRVVVGAPGNIAMTDATAFNVPLSAVNEFSTGFPLVLTNFVFSTAGSTPVAGQLAPRVRLSNLTPGGSVNARHGVQLAVEAGATDGTVARVEYFVGDQKIGESTTGPFGIVWTPSASGSYVLRAVAYDSHGLQTASRSIPVMVFFNLAPTVRATQMSATANQTVSIPLAKLLALARDADGDPLSISALSATSSQGGTVTRNATTASYTPAANFTGLDLFTYTITDGQETALGTVNIKVIPAGGLSLNMVLFNRTADGFRLKFAGIPGASYLIQYRNTLDTGDPWTTLNPPGVIQAGANGLFEYEDKPNPMPASRFYRAAEVSP